MGNLMVYRYRPMRLIPTTTRSVFIASNSENRFVAPDIMGPGRGRQWQICAENVVTGLNIELLLRQVVGLAKFRKFDPAFAAKAPESPSFNLHARAISASQTAVR